MYFACADVFKRSIKLLLQTLKFFEAHGSQIFSHIVTKQNKGQTTILLYSVWHCNMLVEWMIKSNINPNICIGYHLAIYIPVVSLQKFNLCLQSSIVNGPVSLHNINVCVCVKLATPLAILLSNFYGLKK